MVGKINWIGLYTFVRREMERILRITVQTFAAPLISAFLFLFIFGFVLGRKIDLIAGVPYIMFVFPGILVMNIISAAFEHTANAVYFGRWIKSIHEILVAPFSYVEMIFGFVLGAVLRALMVGLGVLVIGLFFGAVEIQSILLFLLFSVLIATIFALLGILVGLWANGFEQLSILNTFIIMPLSFLGGMFYSISLLPVKIQAVMLYNPFFYFIDSMRFATLGYHESNLLIGLFVIMGLVFGLSVLVWYLFKISWRIRD